MPQGCPGPGPGRLWPVLSRMWGVVLSEVSGGSGLCCPVCLAFSPGRLKPLEAQSNHGGPAEHAAQVQGLHTLGHAEGDTR